MSGLLKICGLEFKIGEGPQVVAQNLELLVFPEARQEFLSNRPDDHDPTLPHEFDQFLNDASRGGLGAAKRK